MGIIEGITEFLPVSSTGHLVLAGHLLGHKGESAKTFDIAIQSGAMLAVVWEYRRVLRDLMGNVPGKKFCGFRGWYLLAVTTAPALFMGVLAYKHVREIFDRPHLIAFALILGGLVLIWIEKRPSSPTMRSLDDIDPRTALAIGLWQCLALWPGISRSAATIVGGRISGMDRQLAARYSFLAGVPVLFCAAAYTLMKDYHHLRAEDILAMLLGCSVAFIFALFAIRWFLGLLEKYTLAVFGYYRILLGVVWSLLYLF